MVYCCCFCRRENNQVLGEILFIKHIKEIDYGQYMCSISNSDDQMLQQFINITKPGKFFFLYFFFKHSFILDLAGDL